MVYLRGLYTRVLTADGNFKADHLTPRNQVDDVRLTEGEGFMTAEGPYAVHLKDATENATKNKRVSLVIPPDVYVIAFMVFLDTVDYTHIVRSRTSCTSVPEVLYVRWLHSIQIRCLGCHIVGS